MSNRSLSTAPHTLWDLGYRMTYAEIAIETPSTPGQVQMLHWQDLDHAPDYPVLTTFLHDWQEEHPCTLTSIRVETLHEATPDVLEQQGVSLEIH